MIEILTIDDVKTVIKPWGWEKWIQPGSHAYPFVLKQLLLKQGNRTSLQVHRYKSESIMILSGQGILLSYDNFFNCEKYLSGGYSQSEMSAIFDNIQETVITPNMVFHTPPGTIHRMIATSDLLYMEASTTELDDVIRLQDDNKRTHGTIESEHK
jgi:mannose-1-phosphate guanylyltransferase